MVRINLKKMQQRELNKFLNQISIASSNFSAKINSHKSFVPIQDQIKSSDEENSSTSSSKDASPINTKLKKQNHAQANFSGVKSSWLVIILR